MAVAMMVMMLRMMSCICVACGLFYCSPVLSSSGLEGQDGMVTKMAVAVMVMMLRMMPCICFALARY